MNAYTVEDQARKAIEHGNAFPYDAPDAWWEDVEDGNDPALPVDFAHAAARGIIADLKDRRGIKRGFDGVSEDVRAKIVTQIAEIIRQARKVVGKQGDDKLAAAYHLAKGSFGTAKDHGIRLESVDEVMSEELKHLAANFLRISELLVEAGFRP